MLPSTGIELLLDLRGCTAQVLNSITALEKILADSVRAAGFEVVARAGHQFSHQGVTLVLILSQSHIALHTWPEECFAAVDVYVCGDKETISRALETVRGNLIERFGAQSHTDRVIDRGSIAEALVRPVLDTKEKQD